MTLKINKTGMRTKRRGFTLVEVAVAMAITVTSLAGVVSVYILSMRQAECATYAQAAQILATQRIEQTRAATWNPQASPVVDEVVSANFPTTTTNVLDVPMQSTNTFIYATNTTTITAISTTLKMIRVDCTWAYRQTPFTNSMVTYRSPDQ